MLLAWKLHVPAKEKNFQQTNKIDVSFSPISLPFDSISIGLLVLDNSFYRFETLLNSCLSGIMEYANLSSSWRSCDMQIRDLREERL